MSKVLSQSTRTLSEGACFCDLSPSGTQRGRLQKLIIANTDKLTSSRIRDPVPKKKPTYTSNLYIHTHPQHTQTHMHILILTSTYTMHIQKKKRKEYSNWKLTNMGFNSSLSLNKNASHDILNWWGDQWL